MVLTPFQQDVIDAKICPYCKSKTKVTSELEIYGRSYKHRSIIVCVNFPNCDSYVGCHEDGTPLGRLANKGLRQAKKDAHLWFDKLWKKGYMKRHEAYQWLSQELNLPQEFTHIGMFSKKTCKEVESISMKKFYQLDL